MLRRRPEKADKEEIDYSNLQITSLSQLFAIFPWLRRIFFALVFSIVMCFASWINLSYVWDLEKSFALYEADMRRYQYAEAEDVLNKEIIDKLGVRYLFLLPVNLYLSGEGEIDYAIKKNFITKPEDWSALKARLTSVRAAVALLKGNYDIESKVVEIKKQLKKHVFLSGWNKDIRAMVEDDLECYKEISPFLLKFQHGDFSSLSDPELMGYSVLPEKNKQCGKTYVAYLLKYLTITKTNTYKMQKTRLSEEIAKEAVEHPFLSEMVDIANEVSGFLETSYDLPFKVKR